MISIFNLTLGADESREVAITGEYFELRNALYPVALIELLDRSGGVVSRLENPEQSDFVRPGRYETVRVTNGATPQTIKHFYGTGDAGSRRTSGSVTVEGTVSVMGDVSVIDGEKSRTLAGGMYAGSLICGATAAKNQNVQLWNPAASGKNLIVTQALLVATNAATNTLYLYGTAVQSATLGAGVANKKIGSAVGVGQLRLEETAALPALQYGPFYQDTATSVRIMLPIRGAIVVPPGFGLGVTCSQQASYVSGSFEWFEEPV